MFTLARLKTVPSYQHKIVSHSNSEHIEALSYFSHKITPATSAAGFVRIQCSALWNSNLQSFSSLINLVTSKAVFQYFIFFFFLTRVRKCSLYCPVKDVRHTRACSAMEVLEVFHLPGLSTGLASHAQIYIFSDLDVGTCYLLRKYAYRDIQHI